MSEATPRPWVAAAAYSSVVGVPIVNQEGRRVGNTSLPGLPAEYEESKQRAVADAALIVNAVNTIDRITAERDALRKLFGNSESLHAIIYRHCFNALRFYLGEQRLTGDMWRATEAAAKEIADLTSSLPDAES